MTTYYGLYGQKVQYLASDPTDVQIGQVWYNSTSATLKVRSATTSGTWASGGNVNTSTGNGGGSGSNSSDFLIFGGYTTTYTGTTQSYNGTSWTTVPASLNNARAQVGGAGISNTAALAFGGYNTAPAAGTTFSESYNGTSWTNTPSLNTARRAVFGTGTNTAAIIAGGVPPGTSSESWNGASWTTVGSLTTGQRGGVAGTQTSAVTTAKGGGNNPGGAGATQTWNGSSWTALPGAAYPSPAPAISDITFFGSQTSGVATGGVDGNTNVGYAQTNIFNGSSWTSSTSQPAARYDAGFSGGSSFTDSLVATGSAGAPSYSLYNSTLEWTGPGAGVTRTVTVS